MPRTELRTGASNSNQSTDKLLTLVEFLSEQHEPMRLLDIAKQCDMNVSTVLRFMTALQTRGYVAQDIDTGRYSLTFKICRLGNNVKSHADMRNISLPYLRSVSKAFGESTNLAMEYDMSVMYLEAVPGPHQIVLSMRRIGNIAPIHCTDAGKLFLTGYTAHQLDQLMAVKGLPAYTDHTITNLNRLRKELIQVRVQGYAMDNEECELGARCVAAPVKDFTNKIVAAVSVSGPITRMTTEHIVENLPHLLEAAAKISSHLGYEAIRDHLPTYRR
ncbi:MAG: IclR family transcriptional regulator [Angelakisella sp.]|nr:IclR family transcriptional regulator [Angelakisella sp.]